MMSTTRRPSRRAAPLGTVGLNSRRTPWVAWLALAVAQIAPWPVAHAGVPEDVVARADETVASLDAKTRDLERDLGPGVMSENDALRRFEDSMFHQLVGNHEPAAEGFFALVTTGALGDAGLHLDSEWYLAEALLGMENYETAEQRFLVVANDMAHPFREDAVRRLLELYAAKGDTEAFNALYEREIASGRVAPTPQITYSLGRAFYRQGLRARAAEAFASVPPGTDFHAKAQYHLGVIAVVEERLDDAVAAFEATANLSIDSADGRRVHDLALLALGRIHYERGEFLSASEEYNRIGGDSEYQADKLYEVIWTAIKQERYKDALTNIEIFLLAFPEHRYSAQLVLNQGHLSVQSSDWSGALVSYEQVIVDYEPVRARFATLADRTVNQDDAVAAVLDASRPELEGGLPTYALAMMRADPELTRAVDVFHDLQRQAKDIALSERIIQELGAVISGGSIGSLERLRYDAIQLQAEVLAARLELLVGEGAALEAGDPASVAAASDLGRRRADLQAQLDQGRQQVASHAERLRAYEQRLHDLQVESLRLQGQIDETEVGVVELRRQLRENTTLTPGSRQQIEQDIAALESDATSARNDLAAIDAQVGQLSVPNVLAAMASSGLDLAALEADLDALSRDYATARGGRRTLTSDRSDGLHIALDRNFERLQIVIAGAVSTETSELGRFKKRFAEEVAEVEKQRVEHTAFDAEARDVSLELTRDGFGRLEDFFAESVLQADMGIVDVYWAQKLEIADEIVRMKEEKDALLTELQSRFKLIRQKIGE